jgi:prophage antirepressor-like protein
MELKEKTELTVIKQQEVLGRDFQMYGTFQEPLFLAKDVADWIEYAFKDKSTGRRNVNMMLNSVDEDEKTVQTTFTSSTEPEGKIVSLSSKGQNRDMWFLTEDGLYEVLMTSRKPIAKAFKKEVKKLLKSLRLEGVAITRSSYMIEDPIERAKAWIVEQEEKEQLKLTANIQENRITRLVHNTTSYTTTQLAKEIGFSSATKLNKELHERGIIYKDTRGVWLLYAEYASKGFMNIKQKEVERSTGTEPVYYSVWTGLGRDWLLGLFVG